MSNWIEEKFGDLVEFPPKVKLKKGEKYPFIPMEAIDGGVKYAKPLQEKILTGSGAKFEEGDTLFARITPCLENGKIAQAKELNNKAGFGSTEYFVFRGKKGVTDSDFIYYFSKTYKFRQSAINSMVGASGRQRADANFVKNLKVKIPQLPTQRKISSILSAYDDLIENNLKRIKLLEEKAQLIYEEWFMRMKFPGQDSIPINEETGLPEGWEKVKLEDVLTLNYGKALKASDRIDGIYPVYGSSGEVGSHNDFLISGPGVILGRKGNVGSVFWADENFYAIDTVYYVTSDLSLYYCYFYLKGESFVNNDAAVPGLSRKAAYLKDAINPSSEIIKKFETEIKKFFDLVRNLKKQNQLLKEARDILLPRLMTGIVDMESSDLEKNKEQQLGMVSEEKSKYETNQI